jgi:hypothetical protein
LQPIKQEKLKWIQKMNRVILNQKEPREKEKKDQVLNKKDKVEVKQWNHHKKMIMVKKVKTRMKLLNYQVKMR